MAVQIPAAAITLLAGAIFVLILFGVTDWWELILLAIIITVALYIVFTPQARRA